MITHDHPDPIKKCTFCKQIKPVSAFIRLGSERVKCNSCLVNRRGIHREANRRHRKKNRDHFKSYIKAYKTDRPLAGTYYNFRNYVDQFIKTNDTSLMSYLKERGITPQHACKCGQTKHLVSYWPDYSNPTAFIKLCGVCAHALPRRSAEVINEQMKVGVGKLRSFMKDVRAFIKEQKKNAKAKSK